MHYISLCVAFAWPRVDDTCCTQSPNMKREQSTNENAIHTLCLTLFSTQTIVYKATRLTSNTTKKPHLPYIRNDMTKTHYHLYMLFISVILVYFRNLHKCQIKYCITDSQHKCLQYFTFGLRAIKRGYF